MSDRINIVSFPGTPSPNANVVEHPTSIAQGGNRWRIVVELTWDVLPEDVQERFEGDAPVDFAARALERVRPAMDELLRSEDSDFAHYHILEQPTRCTDF